MMNLNKACLLLIELNMFDILNAIKMHVLQLNRSQHSHQNKLLARRGVPELHGFPGFLRPRTTDRPIDGLMKP